MPLQLRVPLLGLMLTLLAACSGGGGGGSGDAAQQPSGNESFSAELSLSLVNDAGVSVNRVEPGGEAWLRALVTRVRTVSNPGWPDRVTREPGEGVSVTFLSSGGEIVPVSGTAMTNSEGEARVRLAAVTASGAYAAQASVTQWGGANDELTFSIGSSIVPMLNLSLVDDEGQQTSDFEIGEYGTIHVALYTAEIEADGTVTGNMVPAINELITVGTDGGTFDPSSGKVLTDDNGRAKLRFQAGMSEGAHMVTAESEGVSTSHHFQIAMPDVTMSLVAAQSQISAGGQTAITSFLVRDNGQPFNTTVPVEFTSGCVAQGIASITSPALSSGGQAHATYQAGPGCVGADTVVATLALPGQTIPTSASTVVEVAAPSVGSIEFVQVERTAIGIRNAGTSALPETTLVTFRAISAGGAVVPALAVNFSLTSNVGGVSVSPATAVTDANGLVSTTVASGDRPATVRVIATVASTPAVSTQSDQIAITTGRAVQGNLHIRAETMNLEYGNGDEEQAIFVSARDLFNNPVADGTTVNLRTSRGHIDNACQTVDGMCEALWRSQGSGSGRAVILATTLGDEAFVDLTGTGRFSLGDSFTDMPEAWLDINENGRWDAGEPFLDRNGNNRHDGPNGLYDGLLCDPSSNLCGDAGGIDVRDSLVLSLASDSLNVTVTPNPINVSTEGLVTVTVRISDSNGNLPPAGTTIELVTSAGEIVGEAQFEVGNTSAPGPYVAQATLRGGEDPETGVLAVTVSTPGGVTVTRQVNVEVGAGNGNGCEFSPCPGNIVATIDMEPSSVTLTPGRDQEVPISVWALDAERRNVGGVDMLLTCHDRSGGHTLVRDKRITSSHTVDRPAWVRVNFRPGDSGEIQCQARAAKVIGSMSAQVGG